MSEEYQKITIPEYVEYQSLKKKLECAVSALEFYASKDAWYLHKDNLCEVRRSIVYDDTESFGILTESGDNYLEVLGGKRARLALEEIKNGNN